MVGTRAACLLIASAISVVTFAQSDANKIIAQIKGMKDPRTTLSSSSVVSDSRAQAIAEFSKKRDGLIYTLFVVAPYDLRTAGYMSQRWKTDLFGENVQVLSGAQNQGLPPNLKPLVDKVSSDIDFILASHPSAEITKAAEQTRQRLSAMTRPGSDPDQEARDLLQNLMAPVGSVKVAPVVKLDSSSLSISTITDQSTGAKPFELSFGDALTGKAINVADMRGKVVLIDFWATWCPPCRKEASLVKKAYDRYRGKGLRIIGVSLDNSPESGGLEQLQKFVRENSMTWPQYYQGNGWKSEFSSAWKIRSIPTMFAVDKHGKLVGTVDPRDPSFDEQITGLLAQK